MLTLKEVYVSDWSSVLIYLQLISDLLNNSQCSRASVRMTQTLFIVWALGRKLSLVESVQIFTFKTSSHLTLNARGCLTCGQWVLGCVAKHANSKKNWGWMSAPTVFILCESVFETVNWPAHICKQVRVWPSVLVLCVCVCARCIWLHTSRVSLIAGPFWTHTSLLTHS